MWKEFGSTGSDFSFCSRGRAEPASLVLFIRSVFIFSFRTWRQHFLVLVWVCRRILRGVTAAAAAAAAQCRCCASCVYDSPALRANYSPLLFLFGIMLFF
ncbi:unnamed protein product [Pylaiella littoralis]